MIFPNIKNYPSLVKYSIRGQLSERYYRWVEVSPHLFTNTGVDARASLSALVDKKTNITYDSRGRPLWLIIGVTDPFGQLTFDLELFEHMGLNVGPFRKIVLTDGIRLTSTGPSRLEPAANI